VLTIETIKTQLEASRHRHTSPSVGPRKKASYFEGVVTLLKIGCGFVGIRCYNHAAATTSRPVCRAEASARIASEVPCPTVHHQTKKP